MITVVRLLTPAKRYGQASSMGVTVVHHAAAVGFDEAAGAYERGRPSYPQRAIGWLVERTGMTSSSLVVDLAAGTGKLTRLLTKSDVRVIAVEPIAGMRRVLIEVVPDAEVVDGAAEDIPVPTGCVDLVTVAQAFHWFDVPAALNEIHRVLRRGGWLVLVWNRRLLNEPVHRQVSAIVDPHRGATPSHHKEESWSRPLHASPLFDSEGERSFSNVQRLDEEGLVDRVLSTSFIAALPVEERRDVERAVRDLAQQHGGHVDLPYATDVQLFQRADSGAE